MVLQTWNTIFLSVGALICITLLERAPFNIKAPPNVQNVQFQLIIITRVQVVFQSYQFWF